MSTVLVEATGFGGQRLDTVTFVRRIFAVTALVTAVGCGGSVVAQGGDSAEAAKRGLASRIEAEIAALKNPVDVNDTEQGNLSTLDVNVTCSRVKMLVRIGPNMTSVWEFDPAEVGVARVRAGRWETADGHVGELAFKLDKTLSIYCLVGACMKATGVEEAGQVKRGASIDFRDEDNLYPNLKSDMRALVTACRL